MGDLDDHAKVWEIRKENRTQKSWFPGSKDLVIHVLCQSLSPYNGLVLQRNQQQTLLSNLRNKSIDLGKLGYKDTQEYTKQNLNLRRKKEELDQLLGMQIWTHWLMQQGEEI